MDSNKALFQSKFHNLLNKLSSTDEKGIEMAKNLLNQKETDGFIKAVSIVGAFVKTIQESKTEDKETILKLLVRLDIQDKVPMDEEMMYASALKVVAKLATHEEEMGKRRLEEIKKLFEDCENTSVETPSTDYKYIPKKKKVTE